MMEPTPLNATFFAFRRRERRGVLFGATLTYVVIAIVVIGLFGALNWRGVVDYMQWAVSLGQATAHDPTDMSALMPPASVMALGPAYLLFLLVMYVLFAAYEAACLRWMIRGEAGGLFGLSLGADTWRVYLGYWVWLLLGMAAYFVLVVAAVIVGVVAAMASNGGEAAALGAGVGIFVVLLLAISALTYFGVRFAPAAATSVALRRFAFFDAWVVTRDRFGALFGSFVLLILMYLVASLIAGVGMGAAIGATAAAQFAEAPPENPEAVWRALATPQTLAVIAVGYGGMLIAAFMLYLAMFGVNARAALAALEEGKIQVVA